MIESVGVRRRRQTYRITQAVNAGKLDRPVREPGLKGVLHMIAVQVEILVTRERGFLVIQKVIANRIVLARRQSLGARCQRLMPERLDVLGGRVIARRKASKRIGPSRIG